MPSNSNGSPITTYLIEFLESDGTTFKETKTNCDGTDPNVILNSYCLIPLSVFLAAPYSLSQGTLIVGRVYAFNSIGSSLVSVSNSVGVLVQTIPQQPNDMTVD